MEVQEVKEQLKEIFRTVINNDKWITIHPNGEDGKGRHLLLKDGETPKEAIDRAYKKEDKSDTKDDSKDISKEEHAKIKEQVSKMSDDELVKAHFESQKGYESETPRAGSMTKHEATYGEVAQELKRRTGRSFSTASTESEIKEALSKAKSDSKGDLDIKKTTVKMKSGKTKEIEYVDSVPEGYKKLEGAMTAPLGYTWYHNGKSIIDKERKTILVKDKVNNNKEQDMALLEEIKKLISRVENGKESDMEEKIENEKVDKRDIIRQIMAIAGKEEASEDVKTIAKLAEKLAYDKSEAGTADNKKVKNEEEEKADNKKCKNEDEEDKEKVEEIEEDVKKDIDNKKVKNSKEESCFEKINAIYNSIKQIQNESKYTSRQDKLDAAKEYFS